MRCRRGHLRRQSVSLSKPKVLEHCHRGLSLRNAVVALDVLFNRLTTLPDSLPASLRRLDVRSNQLTTLPELPIEFRGLDASSNRLTSLPAVLPAELEILDLSVAGTAGGAPCFAAVSPRQPQSVDESTGDRTPLRRRRERRL